jgi:hypothetical protein
VPAEDSIKMQVSVNLSIWVSCSRSRNDSARPSNLTETGEVTAHLTEWKDEWWYKPSGADSAEWQMAIGSTEEELVDWWVRSQGFQYVEDK